MFCEVVKNIFLGKCEVLVFGYFWECCILGIVGDNGLSSVVILVFRSSGGVCVMFSDCGRYELNF